MTALAYRSGGSSSPVVMFAIALVKLKLCYCIFIDSTRLRFIHFPLESFIQHDSLSISETSMDHPVLLITSLNLSPILMNEGMLQASE